MNGLGFSGTDAELLTSFAQQLKGRNFLSQKQWQILFRRIPKYHKQITAICNAEKLKVLVEKWEGKPTQLTFEGERNGKV